MPIDGGLARARARVLCPLVALALTCVDATAGRDLTLPPLRVHVTVSVCLCLCLCLCVRVCSLPRVVRLYAATFEQRFGEVESLNYARLGWGDEEVLQLAQVLSHNGGLRRLEFLSLEHNHIGDRGACILADALPKLKRLRRVSLGGNRIGPAGLEALTAAKRRCTSPSVVIILWDNDVPAASVLQASNESLESMGQSAREAIGGVRAHLKEAWNRIVEVRAAAEVEHMAISEARQAAASSEIAPRGALASGGGRGGLAGGGTSPSGTQARLSPSPPGSPPARGGGLTPRLSYLSRGLRLPEAGPPWDDFQQPLTPPSSEAGW